MGFQTQVYGQPAPAVLGDFADSNPRFHVSAGPGGLVAGASGVTVGRFAWLSPSSIDTNNAPTIVNNFGGGLPAGFVARRQQALLTTFLAESSLLIPEGFMVELMNGGSVWAKNEGSTQALNGHKAYADLVTGKVSFAAAGAPTTTTQTSATIATGTAATFTGSISGNVLTITGAVTNTLYMGALLSGSGVATGTQIIEQLTGTTGAAGTYAVNIAEQSVASTALTATPYLAAGTGGSGIVVGSTITAASTGTTGVVVGGVVTAIITAGTNVVVRLPYPGTGTNTTATLTFAQNVETKWIARSSGLAGELVKISDVPL